MEVLVIILINVHIVGDVFLLMVESTGPQSTNLPKCMQHADAIRG